VSNFLVVVENTIHGAPRPLEERTCPDQYVGTLGELKLHGLITCRLPASIVTNSERVLLILESPHTSEFRGEPGPAKRRTGLHIARHALSVPGLIGRDNSSLILINAIQHQCSLGKNPEKYRDKVFAAVWHQFGRYDFTSRLAATYRSGDLVVCACTRGKNKGGKEPLRRLVYEATVESLPPHVPVLRRTHPYGWFSHANRDYEWAI
jgi:hypothetical protein